jgi:hypothetical protein
MLKMTIGIPVSRGRSDGLDLDEHGMDAYPGFVPTREARAEFV